MDLESVIQSQVRKRKTNTVFYHIYIESKKRKKNGYERPSGRTGIKTQMLSMDLRTRGGRRVSWDEVRGWHGHIYTTKCKIDS